MAPKPKDGKGLSTEEEAKKKAEGIDDIESDENKLALRIEIRELVKKINDEEKMTGLYNDERLRINYFWLISKKMLEDK